MPVKPRHGPRYDVDWWVISIATLRKLGMGVIILGIAFGLYFAVRMYMDHRAEAAQHASELEQAGSEKPEKSGYFLEIEGDVKVKKKGSYEWIRAEKRLNLDAGDLVKTGSNSSAHILQFDGTEYTVKSESLIMVQSSVEDPATKVRNVAIRISSGAIDMSTAKKNRAESTTELSSTTATTRLGEMTEAGVTVNPTTDETSIQIYRGEGKIQSGGGSMRLSSLESVKVARTGAFSPKSQLLPPPDLIEPPNLKQFAFADPSKELMFLSWRQVQNARYFQLLISAQPLFSTPLVDFKLASKDLSVRVQGLVDGTYFWKVVAIDQNGIEGQPSAVRRFRIIAEDRRMQKFDVEPPPLTVEEPRLSGNIALVRGKTEPGALLTINGEQVDVDSNGSFFHPVILPHPGKNELILVAQDASGNETRLTKTVYAEFY